MTTRAQTQQLLLDWVPSVVLAGVSAHELIYNDSGLLDWVLAQTLIWLLVVRRRVPELVLGGTCALTLAAWVSSTFLIAHLGVLVALHAVAVQRPRSRAIPAALLVEAGAVLGAFLFAPTGSVNDAVILLTGLTMSAVLLGTTQRAQQQYLTALEDRATQLERERNHKAIIAAAEERTRIAREIHDIVAHSVSVMIALSEGAAATPDQTESHGSMRQVAATGRQALAELRLVLSVLHPPEPDAAPLEARVPQPSLAALPQLAQDVRRAGLLVDLRVDEAAGQLPEALQATVFRIVQESLTNTLKHADHPTGSQVQVEVRGDEVIVAIQDDGRQATVGPAEIGGNGIRGMRERAEMFGGSITAGAGTAGWTVTGTLDRAAGRHP